MKSERAPFAAEVAVLSYSPAPPRLIHTVAGQASMSLKKITLLNLEKTIATE
jgi:hypothetical protein